MNLYFIAQIENVFHVDKSINRLNFFAYYHLSVGDNYSLSIGFESVDNLNFYLHGYYLYKESTLLIRGYRSENITAILDDEQRDILSVNFIDIPIFNFKEDALKINNKLRKLLAFK